MAKKTERRDEKKDRERIGLLCLFLGGFFILAGLVMFVLINWINIYAKKVNATIMSSIGITTSDGRDLKSLELLYYVGDNPITTYYTYEGELAEGEAFLPIYYDARNPRNVVNAGWSFEPIFLALLGGIVLLLGLYYKGITDFGIVEMKKPDASSPERVKKTYEAREKAENGLFLSFGAMLFVTFGLYMALGKHNPWMWIFVGIGGLALIYFSFVFVPALIELRQLKIAEKFKGTVVETDEFKNKEKKADEEETADEETTDEETTDEEETVEENGNKEGKSNKE